MHLPDAGFIPVFVGTIVDKQTDSATNEPVVTLLTLNIYAVVNVLMHSPAH